MVEAWAFHMGLELVGGITLRCLFLLCDHDHFSGRLDFINAIVHSRIYRYTLWLVVVALSSLALVHADRTFISHGHEEPHIEAVPAAVEPHDSHNKERHDNHE